MIYRLVVIRRNAAIEHRTFWTVRGALRAWTAASSELHVVGASVFTWAWRAVVSGGPQMNVRTGLTVDPRNSRHGV